MSGCTVQAEAPPSGSVDVSALPTSSTATHSVADAQDTAVSGSALSTFVTCPGSGAARRIRRRDDVAGDVGDDAERVRAARDRRGLVADAEARERPLRRAARRIRRGLDAAAVVGRDTERRGRTRHAESTAPPSTVVTVHFAAPPVGSVDVTTSPLSSTATQSEVDGHDTPRNAAPSTLGHRPLRRAAGRIRRGDDVAAVVDRDAERGRRARHGEDRLVAVDVRHRPGRECRRSGRSR